MGHKGALAIPDNLINSRVLTSSCCDELSESKTGHLAGPVSVMRGMLVAGEAGVTSPGAASLDYGCMPFGMLDAEKNGPCSA